MSDEEKPFNPGGMQAIIDKLKAEGRMPSPEKLRSEMLKARAHWQAIVERNRKAAELAASKKRSSKKKAKPK